MAWWFSRGVAASTAWRHCVGYRELRQHAMAYASPEVTETTYSALTSLVSLAPADIDLPHSTLPYPSPKSSRFPPTPRHTPSVSVPPVLTRVSSHSTPLDAR